MLTQLAALCHHLNGIGKRASVVVPDARVRTYLERAGFVGAVARVANFDPPMLDFGADWPSSARGHGRTLLQLTHLRTVEQLGGVLEHIWQTLCDPLKFPPRDARDLVKVVSELGQNSLEHGGNGGGFIAMQVYIAGGKPFLELGVADCGPGLLGTLRGNVRYSHLWCERDAIDKATEQGVSRFDDKTRGTGLFHLIRLAERHRARVRIRSGRVAAGYRMDLPRRWKVAVAWMPGVHITLNLDRRDGT